MVGICTAPTIVVREPKAQGDGGKRHTCKVHYVEHGDWVGRSVEAGCNWCRRALECKIVDVREGLGEV